MDQVFSISQPWTINGIWCDGGDQERAAVLFLSAGLLRSHGPNRLYVECARHLAAQGISSLRFDLSGIGDSVERSGDASIEAKTFAEVQEVFNALQAQKGIERFVLVGLCSGAYDSIEIALQDERVVSVVSLDGYSVKTKLYKLHWFKALVLPRLLQKKSWMKILGKFTGKKTETVEAADGDLFLEIQDLATIITHFKDLLTRNVSLFCLFTGGVIDEYSYRGQLADADPVLAHSPLLTEVYYPEMDHLLVLEEDRKKVIRAVTEHIASIK